MRVFLFCIAQMEARERMNRLFGGKSWESMLELPSNWMLELPSN